MSLVPNAQADADAALDTNKDESDETPERITYVYLEQEDDVPDFVDDKRKTKLRSMKVRHQGKLSTEVLDQIFGKLLAHGVKKGLLERPDKEASSTQGNVVKLFVPFYQVMRSHLETLGGYVIAPLHTLEQAFSLFAREEECQPKHIGWLFEVGVGKKGEPVILDNYFAIDARDDLSTDEDFRRMGEAIDELNQDV